MSGIKMRSGWKRTMFNKALFVFAYWFVVFSVGKSLGGMMYSYHEVVESDIPSLQRWIMMFIRMTVTTWVTFAFGIVPFLVGAIWCKNNQFFIRMMGESLPVKIMKGVLATAYALFIICAVCPGVGISWVYNLFIVFTTSLPFILWMSYGCLGVFLVRNVATPTRIQFFKGETFTEWRNRIGDDVARDVLYAFMPFAVVGIVFMALILILEFSF